MSSKQREELTEHQQDLPTTINQTNSTFSSDIDNKTKIMMKERVIINDENNTVIHDTQEKGRKNEPTKKDTSTCCSWRNFCELLPGLVFSTVGTILLFMKNSDAAVQDKMNLAGLIILSVGIGLLVAPMLYHLFCPTNNSQRNKINDEFKSLPSPISQ